MLFIENAKPNPLGKDTVGHQARPEQLLGEWVVLRNTGNVAVNLGTFALAHREFDSHCVAKRQPVIYWSGSVATTLKAGEMVRVHTGRSRDWWVAAAEDRGGVHYHCFAEKGWFVLNNDCGDTISVWNRNSRGDYEFVDSASYGRNPPEGVVLERVGNELIARAWFPRYA